MVKYLFEEELEFCNTLGKNYCYHLDRLQASGELDEERTAIIFQNMEPV